MRACQIQQGICLSENQIMRNNQDKGLIENERFLIGKTMDLSHIEIEYFALNLQQQKADIEKMHDCQIEIELQNSPDLLRIDYENKSFRVIQGDIQKTKLEAVVNTSNPLLEIGKHSTQTGVAKKIQQLGGIKYEQACQDYIKENKQLEFGTVFAHNHDAALVKYILTIATPFYEQGSKTEQDLNIIRQNIEAIFKKADQLKIQEITFPIIGGGTSGFHFNSAAQTVISTVLEGLFSEETSVMTVNIVEINPQRLLKIVEITKQIIEEQPKRQVKYQWQWEDEDGFKDYDDYEVNEQIDIAYEEFLNDNNKNSIQISFPVSKSPGTHTVDLIKNTLLDKSLNTILPIRLGNNEGRKCYFFGDNPVSDSLNEFIFINNTQGIRKFDIFYKSYKIVFLNPSEFCKFDKIVFLNPLEFCKFDHLLQNLRKIDKEIEIWLSQNKEYQATHIDQFSHLSKQVLKSLDNQLQSLNFRQFTKYKQDLYQIAVHVEVYLHIDQISLYCYESDIIFQQILTLLPQLSQIFQINEITTYRRQIKKIEFIKKQYQDKSCILKGKGFNLQQFQLNSHLIKKSTLTVKLMNINQFDKISQILKQSIENRFEEEKIQIPKMLNADKYIVHQMIKDNSLIIPPDIVEKKLVKIKVVKQIPHSILDFIQSSIERYETNKRQLGFKKQLKYPMEWEPQEQNFLIKVQNFFKETLSNKIHMISRIQNQNLWKNYIKEKQTMLEFYKNNNRIDELEVQEIELYAWHGTRNLDPTKILQSQREGFNPEYSNERCMWGAACYFAQKASYSDLYSHKIENSDKPALQGKKVILCCLLTTGKIKHLRPDPSLRKPPRDFDSVSGVTRGCNIYMLYQMGARRAYPAYEVIYE